jgi:hypothetical protein
VRRDLSDPPAALEVFGFASVVIAKLLYSLPDKL